MSHARRPHRPRRAVPPGLVLTALAAVMSCGDGAGGSASGAAPGERLYFDKGCVACHGARGEGGFMGPPLRNLSEHWRREELARFFVDPSGYAKSNERLAVLMRAYRTPMTPIHATPSERLSIADWVLAFE